jgi:hypothetical protein
MAYVREGQGVLPGCVRQVATDRRLWHQQRRLFSQRHRFIPVAMGGSLAV